MLSDYDAAGVSASSLPETVALETVESVKKGICLTWKAQTADGYKVYRKTSGSSWTLVKELKGRNKTTWTDKDVKYGTSYTYTVRAFFRSGTLEALGNYSKKGLTQVRTSGVPALVGVKASGSSLVVTWKKAFGAKGYVIYRKNGSGSWKQIGSVAGSGKVCWQDKTAQKGVSYTYTVRSYRTVDGKKVTSAYDKKGVTGKR